MLPASWAVAAVLVQSLLFKFFHLTARKLQESGISALHVLYYQRYAIFPAFFLLLFTFRLEYVTAIVGNSWLLAGLIILPVIWGIAQYLSFVYTNAGSSLSFLKVVKQVVHLPLLVMTGWLLNGDHPTMWSLLAVGTLMLALLLRPAQHRENHRKTLSYAVSFTILLVMSLIVLQSFGSGIYRTILQGAPSVLFGIGLFTFLDMLVLNLFFLWRPPKPLTIHITQKEQRLLWSLPLVWFVASLPEGYGFSQLPIYIFVIIGSIDFCIDLFSDFRNRRISLTFQTFCFVLLTLTSIVLAVVATG